MPHPGALEGVDQTALTDIREADDANGDALHRARLVSLEEAEQHRCGARGEVRALMRARGAEGERWGCVAEVFEPAWAFSRGTKSTSARAPAKSPAQCR